MKNESNLINKDTAELIRGKIITNLIFAALFAVVLSTTFLKSVKSMTEINMAMCYFRSELFKKDNIECTIEEKKYNFTKATIAKIKPVYDETFPYIKITAVLFFVGLIGGFAGLMFFTVRKRTELFKDKHLRGAKLAPAEEVQKMLIEDKKNSDIMIGEVSIVLNSEKQHQAMVGATGQGKTVLISAELAQIRERKQRAIVYDISGEFVKWFYRPGIDIILNPFDARHPNWSLFAEIKTDYDIDMLVNSIIPKPINTKDPFWIDGARTLLESVLRKMIENNVTSMNFLYQKVCMGTTETLYEYVKGTEGAKYIKPDEHFAGGMLSGLATYIRCFKHLNNADTSFSLKDFIKDESKDSWVFIRCNMDMLETMKTLNSLWIDISIIQNLSMEPSKTRVIAYVLDELPTLNKIRLADIANKGRKYGACSIIGIQTKTQLDMIYGKEEATDIFNNHLTKIIFKTPDPEMAELMARTISKQEVLETKSSVSVGQKLDRDSESVSQSIKEKWVVMPAEFQNLPTLTAYLKLSEDYPACKVKLTPVTRDNDKNELPFIPR